jgi:phosphopantetheinyl transferase
MPLLREWKIGDHAMAAIWKIEEPESFFAEKTGIVSDISNERRRIEHLAGRFLLTHVKGDFPLSEIKKDQHDKPRIENDLYYFSISHSWPYIAVVIDQEQEAGIDIQTISPRILDIRHKFLSAEEQALFNDDPILLTAAWSAKEALYKWHGRRGMDFIHHFPIAQMEEYAEGVHLHINLNTSKVNKNILIQTIINIDFTCSFVGETSD